MGLVSPVWVIRDQATRSSLPLDVRSSPKATRLSCAREMSQRANRRHFTDLFDHLVGAQQQCWRHGQAERLGGLDIENCLKTGRLLDRQVGRFRAL